MAVAAYIQLAKVHPPAAGSMPLATEASHSAMLQQNSCAGVSLPTKPTTSSSAVASPSSPAAHSLVAENTSAADVPLAHPSSNSSCDAMAHHLQQWCRQHLPSAAVPASIMVLPQLPLSSAGKLMKSSLPSPPWAVQPASANSPFPVSQTNKQQDSPSHMQDMQGPALQLSGMPCEGTVAAAEVPKGREAASLQPPVELHNSFLQTARPAKQTWSEGEILELFRAALGLPRLEPTDSFLLCGGNSLAATATANALGILPDLITAFPTARKLTAALRQSASSSATSADTPPHIAVSHSHSSSSAPIFTENTDLLQVPPLQLPHAPAGTTAQEEEAWTQKAQRTLSVGIQAGGWVMETAGATRWAGTAQAFSLTQPSDNCMCLSPKQCSNSLAAMASSASQAQPPQAADSCLQQAQSLHQSSHRLTSAWRVKLKECIDASPVVLVTSCSASTEVACVEHQQHVSNGLMQLQNADMSYANQSACQQGDQSQQPDGQPQSAAQQSRQHLQQHQWVFACSHGGDVVCVEGQTGKAVWQTVLPARAEAGLTITSDCQVSSSTVHEAVQSAVWDTCPAVAYLSLR